VLLQPLGHLSGVNKGGKNTAVEWFDAIVFTLVF